MKKYELQKLIDSDIEKKYEHWSPVSPRLLSDCLETLKLFMTMDHRIVETETGNEIIRYE